MNIQGVTISKKYLITIIILLLGLLALLYLVRNPQIFKSRATSDVSSALEVTSPEGEVEYQGNNTYKTNSPRIKIRIQDLNSF